MSPDPAGCYIRRFIQRSHITRTSALPFALNRLAPVVQKLDSAIHRINHCPTDIIRETNCATTWIVIYPMDSVIHLLNNWSQYSTSTRQSTL